MENLHIVTVINEPKYYFPYLEESCERHGKKLEVLGLGEKWTGFNFKNIKMVEYLKKLPENDIVCCVDGFDVICVRDLSELKAEFLRIKETHGRTMVVGDDNLKPNIMQHIGFNYFGNCDNQHINAGTWIGYVRDMLNILSFLIEKYPNGDADDQKILTEYCINNEKQIYVDGKAEIFLPIFEQSGELDKFVSIKNNTVLFNNSKPFFVHAPGGGFLEGILKKLGYSIDDSIKNKLYYDNIIKYLQLPIVRYFAFFFIFFLLCLIFFFYFHTIHKSLLKLMTKSLMIFRKID
jgi:hypothetical protein